MIVLATSGPATEKCSRFKYMIIGIWTFSFLSCLGVGDGGWFGIPAPPPHDAVFRSVEESDCLFIYLYSLYIYFIFRILVKTQQCFCNSVYPSRFL